ncbi:MAG: cupin domain-containing protein [Thermostichus sp. BF3_bins_97]
MTIVRALEGQLLQVLSDRVCLKHPSQSSQNQMSVVTVEVPPGSFVPPHTHAQEEESYFMVKGSLVMTIDQENVTLHPGDFVHIPQGTAHGYHNTSEETVQFLAWSLGGPIDHFFVEMSEQVKALPDDLTKMGQLLVKYGVVMIQGQ